MAVVIPFFGKVNSFQGTFDEAPSGNFQATFVLDSLEATQHVAHLLARCFLKPLPGRLTVFLKGDLGAGKTTLCQFLIRELMGGPLDVPSPTFTLVQAYDTPVGPLWHVDLYRLQPDEVPALGLEDHAGIMLIEWPDRLEASQGDGCHLLWDPLVLHLGVPPAPDEGLTPTTRVLTLQGGPTWRRKLFP